MCSEFLDEIAIEGSFCRCKNGSPPGHWVPVTMFTLGPGICARSAEVLRAIEIRDVMKAAAQLRPEE
jgi:hypothetical protein